MDEWVCVWLRTHQLCKSKHPLPQQLALNEQDTAVSCHPELAEVEVRINALAISRSYM
jgi:hypothetical protein